MTIECPKCQFDNPNDTAFCGKCGTNFDIDKGQTKTIETPIEKLSTGTTFAGRYQIIEELGKGGMGKVYRVLDKKLNEEVALKLIKPDIAADKKTIERFKNELKLARKIRQKNVGSMYELLEEKGVHFITMEYISGQDLKGLIRQTGQLTVGKAVSIAKQICDGLEEAHSLGIIHRDLKPNNIMIDRSGNARIMDFGIARAVKGKSITGSGVMIGTPEYMSPEQVEGEEVDQRSDIYALGVIVYEMLTGHVPFVGDTSLSVALKHKIESPKDPRNINTRISEDLNYIILRCLEKSKEKRFQNTEELLGELNKIQEVIPSTEKVMSRRETNMSKKELTLSNNDTRAGSKQKIFLVIAAIVPTLLTFLFMSYYYSKKSINMDSLGLTSTLSGKPLASTLFYPITVSEEGVPYIDKGLFMDAVNMLRENPDARAVADLIYLERKENYTLHLSESDRRLYQALVSEVPVPDMQHQEKHIDRLFSVYKQIVDGIGQTFAGTPIEIVLHDARNPMRSVQAIQNPISGRQLYQPTTNFGIKLIQWYASRPQQGSNLISYNLNLADGTPIKSTTIPLYDSEYGLLGFICMNIRISDVSEINFDEKTKQFLAAFRMTSSNNEIEEVIDIVKKSQSQKQSEK